MATRLAVTLIALWSHRALDPTYPAAGAQVATTQSRIYLAGPLASLRPAAFQDNVLRKKLERLGLK